MSEHEVKKAITRAVASGARPPSRGPVPKGYRRWWAIVPPEDNRFDAGDVVLFRTWRAALDESMDSASPDRNALCDFIVPLDVPNHALSRRALASLRRAKR